MKNGVRALLLLFAFALILPSWTQTTSTDSSQRTTQGTKPSGACQSAEYYRNSRGVCVHRPVQTHNSTAPAGATAQWRDGSYSFSQSRRGTCSHHGGVAKWL
jgi:hypothetical protein